MGPAVADAHEPLTGLDYIAHLHPSGAVNGDHGGPDLGFNADFGESGTWRVYAQLQTTGVLRTAAFTVALADRLRRADAAAS